VYDMQLEADSTPVGSSGNNPDPTHMSTNNASPSSVASTPEMQSQSGGFTQINPSITNGRSQK
jgi:hypothetical protein